MLLTTQLIGFGASSGEAAAFDPLTLSPYVWLQFNDISTLFTDSAGMTPVTADGDKIGKASDKSGNARHFTQADNDRRASYETNVINGLAAGEFGHSVATTASLVGPDISSLTEGEAFVVIKAEADPPGDPPGNGLWHLGSASSSSHVPYADATIYDAFGTTARKTTGDPATALTSWRLYNAVSASGEWTSFIDGTQHYTTGTNTVGFTNAPRLGGSFDSASYYWVGQIAEFILFSSKLSGTDKTNLEAYFASRYGLTIA
jgi:hypothetical protein